MHKDNRDGPSGLLCLLYELLAGGLHVLAVIQDDLRNPFTRSKIVEAFGTDEKEEVPDIHGDEVGHLQLCGSPRVWDIITLCFTGRCRETRVRGRGCVRIIPRNEYPVSVISRTFPHRYRGLCCPGNR